MNETQPSEPMHNIETKDTIAARTTVSEPTNIEYEGTHIGGEEGSR